MQTLIKITIRNTTHKISSNSFHDTVSNRRGRTAIFALGLETPPPIDTTIPGQTLNVYTRGHGYRRSDRSGVPGAQFPSCPSSIRRAFDSSPVECVGLVPFVIAFASNTLADCRIRHTHFNGL